jgi:hypothetical protein
MHPLAAWQNLWVLYFKAVLIEKLKEDQGNTISECVIKTYAIIKMLKDSEPYIYECGVITVVVVIMLSGFRPCWIIFMNVLL